MSIWKPVCLIAAVAAAPAAAQNVSFSIRGTETCLARAGDAAAQRECIGTSANACMVATPAGSSTMGINRCIDHEMEWWDARLNAAYKRLMASERAEDADFPPPEGVIGQADALRQMQRAWIAFRDATCEYEYTQWTGGTGGSPAYGWCKMSMTGEQAIYLEHAGAPG